MNGHNNINLFNHFNEEINQSNLINRLNCLPEKTFFVDVEIIKKHDIKYEDLIIVDLLLLDAFFVFLQGLKNENLMLVDVYKIFRDDIEMIDKFYKLYNSEMLINVVVLNYKYLYNLCVKLKDNILELLRFVNVEKNEIDSLIDKLKTFSREDDGLCAYLYLYNVFCA